MADILATHTQTTQERKRYAIDYSGFLEATEVIQSVTVNPDAGLTITGEAIVNDDKGFVFFVSGGTNGTTYKVEVLMTTSDGQISEDVVKFKIKDI